jgi:hypothetical protein
MIKNIAVTSLAVIALVVGVAAYTREVPTAVPAPTPTSLGAVANPDLASPYFAFGNVRHWASGFDATVASTTICRAQSPAATSTLVRSTFRETTATGTALFVTVAKTTNGNSTQASSTVLALGTLAASVKGDFIFNASSTETGLGTGNGNVVGSTVFGPNEYITWTVTGGASGINTHLGTGNRIGGGNCTVLWQEL